MLVVQRVAAACLAACVAVAPPHGLHAACATAPTAEAQSLLRKGFASWNAGLLPAADAALTASEKEWRRTGQPADELAAILKARGGVRQQAGQAEAALKDLSEALALLQGAAGSGAEPAEVQRAFVARARAFAAFSRWKEAEADLSAAIVRLDDLDAIEATNPYLFAERGAARSKLGDFAGAADDALRAEADFGAIGDKVRRLLSSADAALALYGADDVPASVSKMRFVFKSKGNPSSNNPDDIALLQELSRKDAELHLAYAAHLYGDAAEPARAAEQWESGCIRLEAFVADGEARIEEEARLQAAEAEQARATGRADTLRASSVASLPLGALSPNSDFNARLNGLDPQSPYVTQRPGTSYFWYKTGEGEVERRDAGNGLVRPDPSLSCAKFRDASWLRESRPEWPPALADNVGKYARAVPQGPIVMPTKGGPPSRGEVVY